MKDIVSLAKRRGFAYPGSEIYGGFANSYTYGPYGVELKNNIKKLWWDTFVHSRPEIFGIDGDIILHPKTWKASGHLDNFNDPLIDCKNCRKRLRVDDFLEDWFEKKTGKNLEYEEIIDLFRNALNGKASKKKLAEILLNTEDVVKLSKELVNFDEKLNNDLFVVYQILKVQKIKCPQCGQSNWTEPRQFNLMFSTQMAKTSDGDVAYLRPETAQAMFLEFKNIVDSMRVKIPFGIAQIGKAFRNEITPGNFIFRRLEFEQMEIEYFIHEEDWKQIFEDWHKAMNNWCETIGLSTSKCHIYEHPEEKLSHYSKRTIDIEYDFPFGRKELYGLAYRTDFDLAQHEKHSKQTLRIFDEEKKEKIRPHVIEPTFGLDRTVLALLCEAYTEEVINEKDSQRPVLKANDQNKDRSQKRIVMKFVPAMAPVKCAVMPLMKKDGLPEIAQEVFKKVKLFGNCEIDISGSVGKRYRRQDEIGTPVCITVDYESKDDDSVTVRDRDTMKQERVKIADLVDYLEKKYFR